MSVRSQVTPGLSLALKVWRVFLQAPFIHGCGCHAKWSSAYIFEGPRRRHSTSLASVPGFPLLVVSSPSCLKMTGWFSVRSVERLRGVRVRGRARRVVSPSVGKDSAGGLRPPGARFLFPRFWEHLPTGRPAADGWRECFSGRREYASSSPGKLWVLVLASSP